MNLICYHERGVESQTEMSDDLIIVGFVFVLLQELGCSGESDLCDIFFYFIRCHTKTVIDKLQGFLFRIDDHFDFSFIIIRESIFSHHFQFL